MSELYRPAFLGESKPLLAFGFPFEDACLKYVEQYGAAKIYILASPSLSRTTTAVERLHRCLDGKVVKTRMGVGAHTPFSDVLDIIHDVRKMEADFLVTLGGGSLTDAAKIVAMVAANNADTREKLLRLPHLLNPTVTDHRTPTIPIICIPTSLSGGEYTNVAGVTDDRSNIKYQFSNPIRGPELIILDESLTLNMPLKVWFASGMRAIDHCVEFLCIPSNDDLAVEEATEGLTLLVNGLLKTKEEPDNLNARQDCQLGVVKSISLVRRWILPGASHGIGHMLGPLAKILHGETSAILLPAVCKYNLSLGANVKEQEAVCEILWSIEPARTLFWNGRLTRSGAHLATLLDVLIRELGLPRSLGEVGLSGDMIEKLAKNSLQDPLLERNPIPLRTKEQVLQVLKLCA